MKYKATNCEFNRANYPHLIGQLFTSPPAYVAVIDVEAQEAERQRNMKANRKRQCEERAVCRAFWAN